MGVFHLVHQKLDIKVAIDPERDEKGIWGTTKLYFLHIEGSSDKDSNGNSNGKKSAAQDALKERQKDNQKTTSSNATSSVKTGDIKYIPIHCRQIDIDTDKVTINGAVTNLKIMKENVEIK